MSNVNKYMSGSINRHVCRVTFSLPSRIYVGCYGVWVDICHRFKDLIIDGMTCFKCNLIFIFTSGLESQKLC